MVIWFMMKPVMHLCIKICNPLKLMFSEPNITLLNLISHFKNHLLEIGKSSHQFQHTNADHIMSWALLEPEFLIIWRMSFLEKLQLANRFSASKVDCDGNTLLTAKQELKISLF